MLDIRYPLDTDMLQLGAATAAIICSNTATVPSHGKQYTSLRTFIVTSLRDEIRIAFDFI